MLYCTIPSSVKRRQYGQGVADDGTWKTTVLYWEHSLAGAERGIPLFCTVSTLARQRTVKYKQLQKGRGSMIDCYAALHCKVSEY